MKTFHSVGKDYHENLEQKETETSLRSRNAGNKLDKRAQELLESGEAKDYRSAMNRAMDEMPDEKRAHLSGLEV